MTFYDLRPYGLSKFSTMLDAAVWKLSLDGGPDEEHGNSCENGWYGLMRGPIECEDLTAGEKAFLTENAAGAILYEDSQGFVSVEYFADHSKLARTWALIIEDVYTEEESE